MSASAGREARAPIPSAVRPFALLSLLSLVALPCRAEERILAFHSDIAVREDGSLRVTETIRVQSEGRGIRRGIWRDFPTAYRDAHGNRRRVGFRVAGVLRNGAPEGHRLQSIRNGTRVYIGREDAFIPPGEHTYALTYETDRQIGFFDDHDELYWNVTGTDWVFPIDSASAAVSLPVPPPAAALRLHGYTGPEGARGRDFVSSADAGGNARFSTTAPLLAGEGLTIVVGWPKGIVRPPTPRREAALFMRDNRSAAVGIIGAALVLVYYLAVWAAVGRDPSRGTVIPLYGPPEGVSPAVARAIARMGYDSRAFAAAVISMAVKGFLAIREEKGVYTLERRREDAAELPPEEQAIAAALFKTGERLKLESASHAAVSAAVAALRESIRGQCERIHFRTNRGHFIVGVLLSAAVIICAGLLESVPEAAAAILFMGAWLTGWTVGVVVLLSIVVAAWRRISAGTARPGDRVQAVFLTLFSLPFLAGEAVGIVFLARIASPLTVALFLLIAGLNVLFYRLLKAPTLHGRGVMDRIDGFRMFLSVAERDRLAFLAPPDRTPELFERFLPYALALGVEQPWAEQFSDVLARAADGGAAYSPAWYSGGGWSPSRPGTFASSLGGSFSSAIASSSRAPGSSSGFGGGGSSGGGGGGGGGGGW
ncbi:MAG: DUF2207 domain-containing protein [bacterium]|nr:DUF2207 domain-containing protein [bacterium]